MERFSRHQYTASFKHLDPSGPNSRSQLHRGLHSSNAMTLTIHKLTTRCRSPRGFQRPDALLEDVAREALASELSAQLGPSLDRLPGVVRIKQLRVRVKIPARTVSAASLVNAWARAITLALHQAIASPAGDGAICSQRYPSPAAYKAAMLYHITNKGLAPCWEFPELEEWRGISPAEAALGVLLADPNAIAEILAQLDRSGWFELQLNKWDELSLERMMQAVAGREIRSPGLSLDNLIELGHAAAASGGCIRVGASPDAARQFDCGCVSIRSFLCAGFGMGYVCCSDALSCRHFSCFAIHPCWQIRFPFRNGAKPSYARAIGLAPRRGLSILTCRLFLVSA